MAQSAPTLHAKATVCLAKLPKTASGSKKPMKSTLSVLYYTICAIVSDIPYNAPIHHNVALEGYAPPSSETRQHTHLPKLTVWIPVGYEDTMDPMSPWMASRKWHIMLCSTSIKRTAKSRPSKVVPNLPERYLSRQCYDLYAILDSNWGSHEAGQCAFS